MSMCPWCDGRGERMLGEGPMEMHYPCFHCQGTGQSDMLPEPPDENDPPDPLNDWEHTNGKEEQ